MGRSYPMSRPRVCARMRVAVREWALWEQKPGVVAYCLATETTVVVTAAALFATGAARAEDWLLFAALLMLGVVQAELGRGVERVRRRVSGVAHINMTSVWTFSAVLLVPPALTAVLVWGLYAHLTVRSWYRLQRAPMWKTFSNAAATTLTCLSGHVALDVLGIGGIADAARAGWLGAAGVIAAVIVYFVVGALVVIPARNEIARSWSGLFGGWADNALELATLSLGVLTGLALATVPLIAVAVVSPILMLHQTVLVKQLQVAATMDSKTGVLNPAGWHGRAEQELHRSGKRGEMFGLLMIDLDHFKRLNDTHGHLAGDAALRVVAATITAEVRGRDVVGRYGGEEFVVLLPGIGARDALEVAERVRIAIRQLAVPAPKAHASADPVTMRLTTSIGLAMYPESGSELQHVIEAADKSLYDAKSGGRNRVAFARPMPADSLVS